jgi:uncharacterized UBP type Zn finger protein
MDAMADGCEHVTALDSADPEPDSRDGCADCLAMGERVWSHLRLCLSCGHVACCDSSPHRHAAAHFHESDHPVIRSFEPGENWRWCYVDEQLV